MIPSNWKQKPKKRQKQCDALLHRYFMKVKLTDRVVDVEVVSVNLKTLWVRLPDGNVIKRHKIKHVVGEENETDV